LFHVEQSPSAVLGPVPRGTVLGKPPGMFHVEHRPEHILSGTAASTGPENCSTWNNRLRSLGLVPRGTNPWQAPRNVPRGTSARAYPVGGPPPLRVQRIVPRGTIACGPGTCSTWNKSLASPPGMFHVEHRPEHILSGAASTGIVSLGLVPRGTILGKPPGDLFHVEHRIGARLGRSIRCSTWNNRPCAPHAWVHEMFHVEQKTLDADVPRGTINGLCFMICISASWPDGPGVAYPVVRWGQG